MADVKWIKITTDIFDDEKMLLIDAMPSADSTFVIWFKLLALAGKQNNSGVFMMGKVAYTDEMLAAIFRRDIKLVRMALGVFEQLGMVEIVNDVVTLPNWNKHQSLDSYEKKKQRDRIYMAERRAAQKALVEKSSDSRLTSDEKSSPVVISEEEKEEEKEERKRNKSVVENTNTLFSRLSENHSFSDELKAKLSDWMAYKVERKEPYKEQGMKALLSRVESSASLFGDKAVCDIIDESMANGWKGIIFDRLTKREKNGAAQKCDTAGSSKWGVTGIDL